ncbi:Cna B-type domain-containing protein [Enterococcus sp. AZ101]|uniref:Cna B-type domain-containing protein n=1 Tax=Enterococcus sp. AZ101 TaxID=2774742 RepID=UPI003D29BC19
MVLTNTHTPETTKVSGTKTWDDKNNQDGKRPEKIIVNLLADGIEIDQKTVTADNKWNYEFTNLPKYKEGKLIHYTVTEDHVPDYSTEINGTSIKNSYTPGQTSVTVTKAWDDANNQDGKRPNGIMVQLYADGKALGAPVQLNTANQWQHTWAELDEKANGKEIIYSVKELDVIDGYDMAVDTSDIGNIIIKNTHVPEKIVITGTKTWEDKNNQDGIRPKEVTVNLLADGEKVAEKVVTEADNWEYAFSDLPKYKEGKEIQYTVTENHVPEYSVEIDGTNLINHYTPGQTSVTVTKAWNDADNQDGKRPENITVQLYANEKKQGEPVSLSDKNLWQHTWTELDEKANGQDIIYSVKETSIDEEYGITIDSEDLGNVIITNSHVPETIELTGTKTWEDKDNQDGKRPESITVLLLANGVPVNEQDVTAANNWQYTFTNLPKYNNGKEIIYTVMENQVPEYSTEIVGIDLINRYTPGKTSVTVNKAWDDADDQAKKRPEKISVQLYANGEKHGEIVTLSSANNWQYSWTELDEKVAGKEIDYTIKEVDIPEGYTATMNDATKHGILLTNTYQSDPPTPDSPEKEIPTKPTKKIGTIIPSLGEVTTIGSILFGIVVLMLASGLYLRNKRR